MDKFDVVVIGGGPGGYLCAERAAQGGLKAAVIEQRSLGGVCVNEGCIPTKSLLYCAKQYAAARHGADYGVLTGEVRYDHAKVVQRKNKVIKTLISGIGVTMSSHNIKVYTATARIQGRAADGTFTVYAGEELIAADRLVIATGSVTAVPPVTGLKEGLASGFVLTNREILDLQELPDSLVCIGGGVIGLEMACYFAAVGVKVTVIEMMDKIAGPTDVEICKTLMKTYEKEGMEFKLSAKVLEIGKDSVTYEDATGKHTLACGKVLLSAGRRANVEGVGLEVLGVETVRGAVVTDRHLCTNVPGVYAIGDCNGKLMLAHTAYREAEVAVNHMLGVKDEMRYEAIPSVIYTNPEVASVGETKASAEQKGMRVKEVKAPMMYSGRYVAETMNGDGFCKLVYDLDRNCLVGVHMIGSYASEMIYGAAMMLETQLPASQLKKLVFPHPTVCEVIREALFKL
ncbi:dihydrolipoyl dehydrogenase [Candidatus Avoscillospira sp. LCP25S3_F1]|uniref:dihydrolipoyl dehydrogenase n=1 Tax=Candidatus Avoscillospira sp. LCP25S3_F1 TaxID=3438825 RepID=UPI003F8EE6AE